MIMVLVDDKILVVLLEVVGEYVHLAAVVLVSIKSRTQCSPMN